MLDKERETLVFFNVQIKNVVKNEKPVCLSVFSFVHNNKKGSLTKIN